MLAFTGVKNPLDNSFGAALSSLGEEDSQRALYLFSKNKLLTV